MRVLLAAALVAASVAAAPAVAAPPPRPNAVVAVVDTGINPYHVVFRDTSPLAYRHPSTYLPGFPKDAPALRLHLGMKDYWAAVRADCQVWNAVQPGKLYWIPGTRIVGGISFFPVPKNDCDADQPTNLPILDDGGHGTMTASRAASGTYGACRTCRIVAVEMPSSVSLVSPGGSDQAPIDAIRWAANNASWIDLQSNSWGPIAPLFDPTGQTGLLAANKDLDNAVEETAKKHLAFWASGNGAAFRGGAVGHPTPLSPHLGPSAIIVGGHDSGYVTTWPGFPPHLVADACSSRAALHRHVSESGDEVGSGTSAATPYVAGGAAQVLLHARTILRDGRTGVRAGGVVASGRRGLVRSGPLADGVLTMAEWKSLVLSVASRRPGKQEEDGPPCTSGAPYNPLPVEWSLVPEAVPGYLLIGYGALDQPAVTLAKDVLLGKRPQPARPDEDAYFATDRQVRETTGIVFRG
ncbi:MAG TPA: S8 family serine peptidase [Mycobacteriales bacterium]|jgi:subtilisin family serine protease